MDRVASLIGALWLLVAATAPGCLSETVNPAGRAAPAPTLEELARLREARDYFTLRDRLALAADPDAPRVRYFQAVVDQAFNQPAQSNAIIEAVLATPSALPETSVFELRQMELNNLLRLYQYRRAAEKAAALLAAPPASATEQDLREIRNMTKLFGAIQNVPAQEVVSRGTTRLPLARGRISVSVNGHERQFVFDTGANLSVVMRSETEGLGLTIREAGVELQTVTDVKPTADLALADRLTIGNIELRNVVFLVLPDEMLSFPDGERLPGIVGFPVIEAMGEVRFRPDGSVEIPETPVEHLPTNLALAGLKLLTLVQYQGDRFVCQLDTGAKTTVFYEPFFRRHASAVMRAAKAETLQATGVGGRREFAGYRMPQIALTLAGRTFTLHNVGMYSQPIDPDGGHLHCNIGLDVLHQEKAYALNLRSMALSFRTDGDVRRDP